MNRREFLAGLSFVGGASVLALWDDSPTYTDSAEALEGLADELNQATLADPQMTPALARQLEDAVETAETGLHSTGTDRAQRTANLKYRAVAALSVLPFVSAPDEPAINDKLAAIEAALDYYTAVRDYLNTAEALYTDLEAVDVDILDTSAEVPAAMDHSEALSRIDTQLSNLITQTEQIPSDSPELSRLLPDHATVRDEATELQQTYTTYADVQNRFLKASRLLQEGALQRENQQLQQARDTFERAASAVAVEIPDDRDGTLSSYSLSIDDYETVLTSYQAGASKLVESCRSDAAKESRSRYSDGLDQLFDAQEVIASV